MSKDKLKFPSEVERHLCGGTDAITPARFNELHKLYGCWYEDASVAREVAELVSSEWFIDDRSIESGLKKGTFFVRTSLSGEGFPFTLVVRKDESTSAKHRIQRVPCGYDCNGIRGGTVNEIIETLR